MYEILPIPITIYRVTPTFDLEPVIKGLGLTAYELLKENGIELYTSEAILIENAIDLFLKNELKLMDVPAGAHC